MLVIPNTNHLFTAWSVFRWLFIIRSKDLFKWRTEDVCGGRQPDMSRYHTGPRIHLATSGRRQTNAGLTQTMGTICPIVEKTFFFFFFLCHQGNKSPDGWDKEWCLYFASSHSPHQAVRQQWPVTWKKWRKVLRQTCRGFVGTGRRELVAHPLTSLSSLIKISIKSFILCEILPVQFAARCTEPSRN